MTVALAGSSEPWLLHDAVVSAIASLSEGSMWQQCDRKHPVLKTWGQDCSDQMSQIGLCKETSTCTYLLRKCPIQDGNGYRMEMGANNTQYNIK